MRLLLKQLSIFKIFEDSNKSIRDLEKESIHYAWYQLLRDSLLMIELETAKKQLVEYCRPFYENDPTTLKQIKDFEETFVPSEAVLWYTNCGFLFNFINKALRTEDIDALFNLRYFIISLSKQLKQLYDQYCEDYQDALYLKVYRGFQLPDEDIQRLKTYIGHYVSTNGFLSTSLSINVAEMFATNVLFEITVDPARTNKNLTFAHIAQFSVKKDEQEVLFDLGATFKITDVKHENEMCIVSMVAVTDIDLINNAYVDHEREQLARYDIEIDNNFRCIVTFGMYLIQMGQFDKSISYFRNLLFRTRLYEYERYFVLKGLARAYMKNGEHDTALEYAFIAYKINKLIVPDDTKEIEIELGKIYNHREEYNMALQHLEEALKQTDPNDFDTISAIHTNMALAHFSINNFSIGFELCQRTLQMLYDSSQSDPTTISDIYMIMARGHYLGNCLDAAIEYCQTSLSIRASIYPDNNPILIRSYYELGYYYDDNDQYELAIEYFSKAVELYQKYSNENDLLEMKAMIFSEIARCYIGLKQFQLSVFNFEKALEMHSRIIPLDEKVLAELHEKIAVCYWSRKEFKETSQHYEIALELKKKILSSNDDIISLYRRIGICYNEIKEYALGRQYYQKALNFQKEIDTPDESLTAGLYNCFGSSYESEKNYDASLEYYHLELNIRKKSTSDLSELIQSYRQIAKVYASKKDYDLAIESLEQALKIQDTIIVDGDAISTDIHMKLAVYYKEKKEYIVAIKHYEHTVNIYTKLDTINNNILLNLYEGLARLYYQQEDYCSALKTNKLIEELFTKMSFSNHTKIADLYNKISKIYCESNCYDCALDYSYKSMDIITEYCNNEYVLAAENNEILADIYQRQQANVSAKMYYEKALELYRIIGQDDDVKRIENILQSNLESKVGNSWNLCSFL
ncbi:unnamed protein product [Rotaria sp. Silwood2]|nr:unnamed protein product [Rotaria sp. Silwood2]CAF4483767.1 unnamed protein product [Rotaria sp. Silwood2]